MDNSAMHFIEQRDPVMPVEKNAVFHAAMLHSDVRRDRRWTLAALLDQAPAALADQRDGCPVGTVEFCRAWMRATGVPEPAPLDYPECLRDALGRPVRQATLTGADDGDWIKPLATKAWDARRKQPSEQSTETVWVSPFLPQELWQAEWRVYLLNGRIVGTGRYDDRDTEYDHENDPQAGHLASVFAAQGHAPAGYALDMARVDGRTLLVEVTDGWAIGLYQGSCRPADYVALIRARWRQLSPY